MRDSVQASPAYTAAIMIRIIMLLWAGIGLALLGWILVTFLQDHCAGLTEPALTSCHTGDSYQGLGFIGLFAVWLIGAVVIGLVWLVRRRPRRPVSDDPPSGWNP
jgi:hypothetical protein